MDHSNLSYDEELGLAVTSFIYRFYRGLTGEPCLHEHICPFLKTGGELDEWNDTIMEHFSAFLEHYWNIERNIVRITKFSMNELKNAVNNGSVQQRYMDIVESLIESIENNEDEIVSVSETVLNTVTNMS